MKDECFGKELAEYKLNRAREELDTANLLFDNEKLKAANNRAYYSIYYAITAVLCLEPVAFKIRHVSDYDEFYIASKEEAQKQIHTAEAVIELVMEYIGHFYDSEMDVK